MKYGRKRSFASLLFVLLITGGCASSQTPEEIEPIIQKTQAYFLPDSRVDLFRVKVNRHADSLVLSGETTIPQAKAALLDSLSKRNIAVTDSIIVLPSPELGPQTYALVNNSVANIRSKPGHPAQLATQALLGMPLQVLKKTRGWYLVKTPDDYLSWVDSGGITRMDKSKYNQWVKTDKLIYTNTYGFSYKDASNAAEHVTDLVAGDILKLEGSHGSYYKISYPDGRTGYIAKEEAKPFGEWNKHLHVTQKSLVQVGKTMMGAPYLWGGTSTKGIDCSGFTKTIYFMNGWIIPRDASQQIQAGKQVDNQKNWQNLETGDLLFFGHAATDSTDRRVVHVGMWIGNNQFIHSSGKVRISSVDSTAQNYDPYNIGRYLQARRYLQNWTGNIKKTADMYTWDEKIND